MFSLLLAVLLNQLACVPGDTTNVCYCKQRVESACEVVRLTEPEVYRAIEAAQAVLKLEEDAREAANTLKEKSESDCGTEEPDECKGQWHHIISKLIFKALQQHKNLRGKYEARDSRFVSRAKDQQSHCGYQTWHRNLDKEVTEWLKQKDKATPQEFEAYLRELYKRPELLKRFPHGF